ncbi:MAG: hypothetical protein ACFCUG_11660 [Thiotrichales bacterium]
MLRALSKGGILAALILFAWGAISWMVLPWHLAVLEKFPNEEGVARLVLDQVPRSGMYVLPLTFKLPATALPEDIEAANAQAEQRKRAGPVLFAAIGREGSAPMGNALVGTFAINLVAALMVTALVWLAQRETFWARWSLVTLFACAAAVAVHLPYWNWWSFTLGYTLVAVLDLVVGWMLAGVAIAWATRRVN